jgi:Family of unknown function (DUF6455)
MTEPLPQARRETPIWKMMVRLGIEPGASVVPTLGLRYAAAFHVCEACSSKDSCRAWLARAPAEVNFAPRFCPGADILFELQFDQPGLLH